MECIKCSEDMYAMQQALAENDRFKNLDRKTSNVMRYCSRLKIDFETDEEEFDMCKAFEDYKDLGKSEGFEEGIAIGKNEGLEEGIAIGEHNGLTKGLAKFATYLLGNNVAIEEIVAQTGLSYDEIIKIKETLA
ncbi:MAG: hypothetical protein J6A58_12435, partial [Oscillospiraceae bacterium]|nr:hypothetical protein [Oscillospiraceae bacterium]